MASLFLYRWRDDQFALIDYLETQANTTSLLGAITGGGQVDHLVYMGYSFGAAASCSSAQLDSRADCAVNMDGGQGWPDLFGISINTPLLAIASDYTPFLPAWFNEFYYEAFETMVGSDANITRILLPNTTHQDFTDAKFLPDAIRQLGGGGTLDGDRMHDILVSFVTGFLSMCFGDSDWTPESSFQEFPGTMSIDVSYVADWYNSFSRRDHDVLAIQEFWGVSFLCPFELSCDHSC